MKRVLQIPLPTHYISHKVLLRQASCANTPAKSFTTVKEKIHKIQCHSLRIPYYIQITCFSIYKMVFLAPLQTILYVSRTRLSSSWKFAQGDFRISSVLILSIFDWFVNFDFAGGEKKIERMRDDIRCWSSITMRYRSTV